MIEIEDGFDVPADADRVWAVLSDRHAVVGCVPGAELGQEHEDGTFDAGITVKFGPLRVAFHAVVAQELDAAARSGHMTAKARDQGGTRVQASMTYGVAEAADGSSRVTLLGQVELTGKLAGMIEGGATAVVKQMTRDFASRLASRLGSQA